MLMLKMHLIQFNKHMKLYKMRIKEKYIKEFQEKHIIEQCMNITQKMIRELRKVDKN